MQTFRQPDEVELKVEVESWLRALTLLRLKLFSWSTTCQGRDSRFSVAEIQLKLRKTASRKQRLFRQKHQPFEWTKAQQHPVGIFSFHLVFQTETKLSFMFCVKFTAFDPER